MVTLSAANTFSGVTLVSGGTLTLANPAALSMSTFNASSGTGAQLRHAHAAAFGGLQGAASSSLTLNNTSGTAVALSVGDNGVTTTYYGELLPPARSLTKVGGGMLTLSGTDNYGGGTTISGGVLAFNNSYSVPSSGTHHDRPQRGPGRHADHSSSPVSRLARQRPDRRQSHRRIALTNGATMRKHFALGHVEPAFPGRGTRRLGHLQRHADPVGQHLLSGRRRRTLTFASNLPHVREQQSRWRATAAAGRSFLTASNSYSGATTIYAGTLQIGSGGCHGHPGQLPAPSPSPQHPLSSTPAIGLPRLRTSSAGPGGQLSRTPVPASLTLSASNTYTGGTTVSGGTLRAGSPLALGSACCALSVAAAGTFDLYGNSLTVANLTLSGSLTDSAEPEPIR